MISIRWHRQIIFIEAFTVCALIFAVFTALYLQHRLTTGRLEISPEGGNHYYDPLSGVSVSGMDIDGTTYFFLPAFISNDRIEQTSDTVKVYNADGSLLERAAFDEIQEILVDQGDGQMIPWKMCFMKSANINSMFIDSGEASDASDLTREAYSEAGMMVYSPEGNRIFSSENISIKGRGNYSWQSDKKPMEIKLQSQASLCGLSPSKKWALLSNYYDPTMLLNKLAMDLADETGVKHTSDSDWLDVYFNGIYMGNYLLCKEPGTTAEGVEFLFRKEIPHTYKKKPHKFISNDLRYVLDLPDETEASCTESIRDYVDGIDKAIRADEFEASIDEESFIRRFLIEEFFYNADALSHSYYFYKYPNDIRLYAGPCWDYDLAGGGFFGARGLYYDYDTSILEMTEKPEYVIDKSEWLDWDSILFRNPAYYSKARMAYIDTSESFRDTVNDGIDTAYETIKQSAEMDNIRWKDKTRHYYDYYNEIRHLKFFLSHRLGHMESLLKINEQAYPMDVNTGEYHNVTFVLPDGSSETIEVKDGTRLNENDLPQKAEEGYGWVRDINDEALFSGFFPVYEDTVYEMKEISYDS